ncbi:hypothetical protein LB518_22705 [Mesorhizobium sp. BR1-1-16]|uniref:baseplate J/gp47 family protein n=1 Tax=Mesorhizobium sp. BR1-1-16 TaxID=2876653 RepID=UPI001CCAC34F|nr:hypothetical protein [Mesorhizobium sp. BR1-1-16]MBZ9939125.1 hypothetical protein [Mesorhizobium sp. BR1-1-16]
MSVPIDTIDENGITMPTFDAVLSYFQDQFRNIYGQDVYLGNDSQDGQWVGIIATAHYDSCAARVAAYNAFSPATAQGGGLSSVVKINGIARAVPTNSTVDLTIVGQAGTTITNGIASDGVNRWLLPASVVVPGGGSITVTATAQNAGAITALSGTVTTITTPTLGWQSVTNAQAATAGAPVESDAALRRRQATSTMIPSLTVLEGIVGAIANLAGVTRYAPYENDTDSTDGNGVPSHSIALVVEGGDAAAIAGVIAQKKAPGTGTYGTTTETVTDAYGIPHVIEFFRPTVKRVKVSIALTALAGYTTGIGNSIKASVAAYNTALAIGGDVYLHRIYTPANLGGAADSLTYNITAIQIAFDGDSLGTADLVTAFNEAAFSDVADVTLVVT